MNRFERLAQEVGYRIGDQTQHLVGRAVDEVARTLCVSAEEAEGLVLSRSGAAWRTFSEAVAIHETYFFRHPEHFELLDEHARRRSAEGAPVRSAWSVKGSSGEELWSMALTLWPWGPSLVPCPSCSRVGLHPAGR